MPDAVKAVGQHVDQEPADELVRGEPHHLLPVAGLDAVVLPAEGDRLGVRADQAGVRDGDTVGVAAEIGQHRLGAAEGRLGVDHPLGSCAAARSRRRRPLRPPARPDRRRRPARRRGAARAALRGTGGETGATAPAHAGRTPGDREPNGRRPATDPRRGRSCGYGDGGSAPSPRCRLTTRDPCKGTCRGLILISIRPRAVAGQPLEYHLYGIQDEGAPPLERYPAQARAVQPTLKCPSRGMSASVSRWGATASWRRRRAATSPTASRRSSRSRASRTSPACSASFRAGTDVLVYGLPTKPCDEEGFLRLVTEEVLASLPPEEAARSIARTAHRLPAPRGRADAAPAGLRPAARPAGARPR